MTQSTQPGEKKWSKLAPVMFPLILALNLLLLLFLVIELKDYDSTKKELLDKSALIQEVTAIRFEISTLKAEKESLEIARKELTLIQAKLTEARSLIAKAEILNSSLDTLRSEETAINLRLLESRKAITNLIESRSKMAEADKIADQKIARASALTEELNIIQSKLNKAASDLQTLEDARSERIKLISERTSIKSEIAQINGQKDSMQKELDQVSKNLGQAQAQLKNLVNKKAELESEISAQQLTIQKQQNR